MALENLGKKLAQLGQDTKSSVQKISENYSLNNKVAEEKKALDQVYAKIGEAIVEKINDGSLPAIEGLDEQIGAVKAAKEAIAALEDQIQKLKGVTVCPECGKEAPRGEKFCSACGAKLPEEPEPEKEEAAPEGEEEAQKADSTAETVGDAAEQITKDAKAIGNEVGDAVNEAADKAKVFFGNVADKAGAFLEGVSSRFAQKAAEYEDAAVEESDVDDFCEVDDAAEDVAEAAQDAADAAQEAVDAAQEAAEDAADAAQEAAEDAADAAQEAVDAAQEAAEDAADAAQEAAQEAAEETCEA